jgi:hypothetical protein
VNGITGLGKHFPNPVFGPAPTHPSLAHPGKLILHPNPQAEEMTSDVVFLPHVGEVKIAKAIILIKTNQESAVTDWDVSRHRDRPFLFRMKQTRVSILV